ncbi:MAG: carbamate kinase [Deltaproteobacteria bacterium]|nr:carbamate kinase [Deltaproteobacteria bacterium]
MKKSLEREMPPRVLVAIGGNATHPEDIAGTPDEQWKIANTTAQTLLPLLLLDNELVITHGNGPVVGKILMRMALTRDRIPAMTMDICVAHSQAGIAYLLVQAMENALRESGSPRHVVCLLTQVEVDPKDPSFENPIKPVGPFFSKQDAAEIARELGWTMKEDSGRGWRYTVPSPKPLHICDISLIQALAQRGTVVIAGGGGGIPVIRGPKGVRHGINAVIDKDLSSALMANVLGIEVLVILTSVSNVAINFGRPDQRDLHRLGLAELRRYQQEGHFVAGSMGPKVEAAIRFLELGGKRAIIGRLEEGLEVITGQAGTHIVDNAD